MWIIYFNGAPHFWLSCGKVYRIGKKGCDITIKDDPSISRTHLSFEIGLSPLRYIVQDKSSQTDTVNPEYSNKPKNDKSNTSFDAQDAVCDAPAAITLIDSSTYGSTAIALGTETDLLGLRKPLATASTHQSQVVGVTDRQQRSHVVPEEIPDGASLLHGHLKSTLGMPDNTTNVVQKKHRLVKGIPFRVPLDRSNWRELALVLGNHGATLVFAWSDLCALIENVEEDQRKKLEGELNYCGVKLLSSRSSCGSCTNALAKADFLVSSFFEPTPWSLSMLCRMTPIVLPSFFSDILNRSTSQAPLPDPCCYLPPVSPVWKHFTPPADYPELRSNRNSSVSISSDFLKPNIQRRDLFTGFTFVVLRQALLEEIAFFVECAKGCVVLDDRLSATSSSTIPQADLAFFTARHKGHIIVLKNAEKDALETCMMTLNNENQVQCVTFDKLVRCVVLAESLSLTISQNPSSDLTTHVSPTGKGKCVASTDVPSARSSSNARKTEAMPVFSSLNSPERGPDTSHEWASSATATNTKRFVDTHGWISRRNSNNLTVDRPEAYFNFGPNLEISTMAEHKTFHKRTRDELGNTDASYSRTSEPGWSKFELLPYPCFQAYDNGNASNTTAPISRLPGRQFSKQYVEPARCPQAELDMSFLGPSETDVSSSRVLDLASCDIVPDRRSVTRKLAGGRGSVRHYSSLANSEVLAVGGVVTVAEAFNVFDTAAHNSVNKKRATLAKKRIQTERSRNLEWNTRHTVPTANARTSHEPLASSLSTSHAVCNKVDTLEAVGSALHRSERQNSTHEDIPIDDAHKDFNIFDIDGIF